jgi:hypothetical protein
MEREKSDTFVCYTYGVKNRIPPDSMVYTGFGWYPDPKNENAKEDGVVVNVDLGKAKGETQSLNSQISIRKLNNRLFYL